MTRVEQVKDGMLDVMNAVTRASLHHAWVGRHSRTARRPWPGIGVVLQLRVAAGVLHGCTLVEEVMKEQIR